MAISKANYNGAKEGAEMTWADGAATPRIICRLALELPSKAPFMPQWQRWERVRDLEIFPLWPLYKASSLRGNTMPRPLEWRR